jgi:hypothetical protein
LHASSLWSGFLSIFIHHIWQKKGKFTFVGYFGEAAMIVRKADMLFIFYFALLMPSMTLAQHRSANDTILLGAIITDNGDTIGHIFLPEFVKTDKLPRRFAHRQEYDAQLRYNVYKTYPYACMAADILKDVDVNLDNLDGRKDRKAYLKSIEKQLNQRFKGELEDLTINQGQILVRLIDRQTGKNCYSIVRELKGGFSAVIWQSVALLFSNNLKREYDPTDRDKDIEVIVKELEESNYYKYKIYQQQMNLQAKRN